MAAGATHPSVDLAILFTHIVTETVYVGAIHLAIVHARLYIARVGYIKS